MSFINLLFTSTPRHFPPIRTHQTITQKQEERKQSEDHYLHSCVCVTFLLQREAKPMRCCTFIINLSRRPSLVFHTSSILRPLLRKASIFSWSWCFRILSSARQAFVKKRTGRFYMADAGREGVCGGVGVLVPDVLDSNASE